MAETTDPTPAIREAAALHQQGRHDQAELAYRNILKEHPAEARVWNMLGQLLAERGRPRECEAAIAKAIELQPETFVFHYFHGLSLLRLNRMRDAADAFAEACRLNPEHIESHRQRCLTLRRLGDADALREATEEMHASLPSDPDEALRTAAQYEGTPRDAEAGVLLRHAARVSPEHPGVLTALGRRLLGVGEAATARTLLEKAVELAPETLGAAEALVLASEASGDGGSARWFAGEALQRDPGSPELLLALGRLDRIDGDLASAQRTLEELFRSERVTGKLLYAKIAYELGRVYEAGGAFDHAFDAFTRAQQVLTQRTKFAKVAPQAMPSMLRFMHEACQTPPEGWPETSERTPPVYVVGFPGSGVSLAGKLLAQAQGATLLPHSPLASLMNRATAITGAQHPRAALDALTDEQAAELRRIYEADARDAHNARSIETIAEETPLRWIDASPMNGVRLALVRRLFPDAPVIIAARDPRDACITAFRSVTEPDWASVHTHEPANTARFVGLYTTVLRKGLETLGLHTHTLRYEDLLKDPEAEIGKALAFAGLRADAAALAPQVTPRKLPLWHNYAHRMHEAVELLTPMAE
ncbi:MAG: sulfotransferase family protein [Phycisphaerales bacterium]|nr:MAG: sulfotransferase family protein [Phycisphaerales bacterium]